MTWKDVPSVNAGVDVLTAAMWNTYVRDNLHHLRHQTETAAALRNTSQTINNATVTAVSFTIELWDNANMWQSPKPTRFFAPTDGRYLFTATVSFQANATGVRTVWLRASNAGGVSFGIHRQNATSSDTPTICCSGLVWLDADDYVEVYVEQNSGDSLDVWWARAGLVRVGG